MLSGTQGNKLSTSASIGALNIALRHLESLGISVKPARKTITHTISRPRATPNKAPKKRFNQPNPAFLKIADRAMPNNVASNKVAKKSTKKSRQDAKCIVRDIYRHHREELIRISNTNIKRSD